MGFACGIVGLPNVGKSTIFKALTAVQANIANFPFCTIEPNTGVVWVPDPRLTRITEIFHPEKTTPTTINFVDIAGLVKGASKGEGLGNQFLANIREADAIAHVVRCFEDKNVTHVSGLVDPLRDVEIIDTELMLADLQTVEKRWNNAQKETRSGDKKAVAYFQVLTRIKDGLEKGTRVRSLNLSPDEKTALADLHLLTAKQVFYVANVNDSDIEAPGKNPHFQKLMEYATIEGSPVVAVSGKMEAELAELSDDEKGKLLQEFGMEEPALYRVIRAGYAILNLLTFFTAGPKEVRAWTITQGAKAPQAAGVIHSDFERGFIRAEIYHYDELMQLKSEKAIHDAGKLRLEGKDYVVRDGDIVHFRFSI